MAVDLGYKVERQFPGIETLGSQGTRDVTIVGITTNGHGVYLEFRIPQAFYSAQQVKNYSTGYTGTIESMFAVSGVVGLQWIQQVSPANELQDAIIVTVASDSGDSTGQFTVPFRDFKPEVVAPKAAKLIAELNAAEAGS